MRRTAYGITFFLVAVIIALNVISTQRVDWLVIKYPEILLTKVTVEYGLTQQCTQSITRAPGSGGNSGVTYRSYKCNNFPEGVIDGCDKENRLFCTEWASARYVNELGIGFGAVSLLAILFGLSTHSRRRRVWKSVAWLVFFQALCQLMAFAIITDNYNSATMFEQARPGTGYVLNILGWAFGVLITLGVVTAGISADSGHRWAAGDGAYHPIPDGR